MAHFLIQVLSRRRRTEAMVDALKRRAQTEASRRRYQLEEMKTKRSIEQCVRWGIHGHSKTDDVDNSIVASV